MASLLELFASSGISGDLVQNAFQTRDPDLLKNMQNLAHLGADQSWQSALLDPDTQMESKLVAAKAKYEREKTSPNAIKKLGSPVFRAQLIRENDHKKYKDQKV